MNSSPKTVFLSSDQLVHIKSLVDMRLTELILAGENPNIIRMYQSILTQIEGKI